MRNEMTIEEALAALNKMSINEGIFGKKTPAGNGKEADILKIA